MRVASNGRETVWIGSPGRGEPMPRMFVKPAWATSRSGASVEPLMTAMQSPRRIASAASATLWVPVEQAETMADVVTDRACLDGDHPRRRIDERVGDERRLDAVRAASPSGS